LIEKRKVKERKEKRVVGEVLGATGNGQKYTKFLLNVEVMALLRD
jgi:hypothetical protein